MRIRTFLMMGLLFSLSSFGGEKSDFDLNSLPPSSVSKFAKSTSLDIENLYLEATLIEGGYFTLGTKNGLSSLTLDDHCDIAYGHPYAMTSHPVLAINGIWGKPGELMTYAGIQLLNPQSLQINYNSEDKLNFTFSISLKSDSVCLSTNFKNNGETTLRVQPGLIFDPSIGEHGDASVQSNNTVFSAEDKWTTIPSNIQLWERNSDSKGIGASLGWDTSPSVIRLANWRNIADQFAPDDNPDGSELLYDLTMGIYWDEITLQPGDSTEVTTILELLDPKFDSELFMRWDLPNFLTLENNIMFPTTLTSTVDIWNQGEREITDGTLCFAYPDLLESETGTSTVSVPKVKHAYPIVDVEFPEIFEDQIMPLKLTFEYHGAILDSLIRNVYVPATPLSDTGLVVTIDSVFQEDDKVHVIFDGQIEKTGWRLTRLRSYNVFLFEDNIQISPFDFGKSTLGGSNLADVVFVLDCSGSMGNEIDQVRQYIGEFGDELNAAGYDFQVGIVTFSTTVDDIWDFTNDLDKVRANLASVDLWGGVEDSPSALMTAMNLSFRPGSKRTIIWITDEDYPTDNYSVQDVVNRALEMDVTIHGIGLLTLQTDWFEPITLPTGGNFYDITGNFLDILLDVSRQENVSSYQLAYDSDLPDNQERTIQVEIHYGGRGGSAEVTYTPSVIAKSNETFLCYPNPFNPELTIRIQNPESEKGLLKIYNVVGQQVFQYPLSGELHETIRWNARSQSGQGISSGYYFVRLEFEKDFQSTNPSAQKVLYLK